MDTLGKGVHWGGDTSKGKCSQAAIFTRKADVPRPEMKYEKEINLGSFQWASVDEGPWKCRHAITIPKEGFSFFTDNTASIIFDVAVLLVKVSRWRSGTCHLSVRNLTLKSIVLNRGCLKQLNEQWILILE